VYAQLGEYELAWVDGEIGDEEDDTLSLLPLAEPPPHKAVYVGKLQLPDFKELLGQKGVQVRTFTNAHTILCTLSRTSLTFRPGFQNMSPASQTLSTLYSWAH
jgi:hypothetical protein